MPQKVPVLHSPSWQLSPTFVTNGAGVGTGVGAGVGAGVGGQG